MAKGNFDACLKEVLLHEGGYVNHAADPGGRTNLGVTQKTYEAWVGYPVSEKIMRSLTVDHVRALYKVKYWDKVRGDDLPLGLDLCVFDFGVNAGPARAVRYLQSMVGAKEDGVIGPRTLSLVDQMVKALGADHCVARYQDARRDYYRLLKTFPTFGRGWLRRVKEVEHTAIAMIPKGLKNG
jgi:lysozyme family protein